MKTLKHILTIIYIVVLGSIALLILTMDDVSRLIIGKHGRWKIRKNR